MLPYLFRERVMMTTNRLLVVMLGLALAGSGCGDDSGEGGTDGGSDDGAVITDGGGTDTGSGDTGGGGLTNPFEGDPTAAAEGQTQFANNCALCHGQTAEGVQGVGSALAGTTLSDGEFYEIVRNGTDDGMLPFAESILSDDNLWKILTWLRMQ